MWKIRIRWTDWTLSLSSPSQATQTQTFDSAPARASTDVHCAQQKAIERDFGSYSTLVKQTNAALAGIQGSGWAWIAKDKETGTLSLVTRANQDPVTGNLIPLLGIDAWEHAYYLQYQNRKAEYFSAIWNVINWKTVAKRFSQA